MADTIVCLTLGTWMVTQNQMRACLSRLDKSTTFYRAHRFHSADAARDFHDTARIGSCEKCNRTLLGR
jgi:hypothetical protein